MSEYLQFYDAAYDGVRRSQESENPVTEIGAYLFGYLLSDIPKEVVYFCFEIAKNTLPFHSENLNDQEFLRLHRAIISVQEKLLNSNDMEISSFTRYQELYHEFLETNSRTPYFVEPSIF